MSPKTDTILEKTGNGASNDRNWDAKMWTCLSHIVAGKFALPQKPCAIVSCSYPLQVPVITQLQAHLWKDKPMKTTIETTRISGYKTVENEEILSGSSLPAVWSLFLQLIPVPFKHIKHIGYSELIITYPWLFDERCQSLKKHLTGTCSTLILVAAFVNYSINRALAGKNQPDWQLSFRFVADWISRVSFCH